MQSNFAMLLVNEPEEPLRALQPVADQRDDVQLSTHTHPRLPGPTAASPPLLQSQRVEPTRGDTALKTDDGPPGTACRDEREMPRGSRSNGRSRRRGKRDGHIRRRKGKAKGGKESGRAVAVAIVRLVPCPRALKQPRSVLGARTRPFSKPRHARGDGGGKRRREIDRRAWLTAPSPLDMMQCHACSRREVAVGRRASCKDTEAAAALALPSSLDSSDESNCCADTPAPDPALLSKHPLAPVAAE